MGQITKRPFSSRSRCSLLFMWVPILCWQLINQNTHWNQYWDGPTLKLILSISEIIPSAHRSRFPSYFVSAERFRALLGNCSRAIRAEWDALFDSHFAPSQRGREREAGERGRICIRSRALVVFLKKLFNTHERDYSSDESSWIMIDYAIIY